MASKNNDWSNIFRLSVNLNDVVNPHILQKALYNITHRFPTIIASIHKGWLWYYQKAVTSYPVVSKEKYLLKPMSKEEIERCATRVMYSDKSIIVELFHSITDGKGGVIFLKSLLFEYLKLKENINVEKLETWDILNVEDSPLQSELRDEYKEIIADSPSSNIKETKNNIFQFKSKNDTHLSLTNFNFDINKIKPVAKSYNVSLTVLITSIIAKSIINIQRAEMDMKEQKTVKLFLPIDLRNIFGKNTLRNFVFYIKPEIDPNQSKSAFSDIICSIENQMKQGLKKENLETRIEKNIKIQNNSLVKIIPLPLKEKVLRYAFKTSEKSTALTVSNLGIVEMPDSMKKYIQRFDCILNTRSKTPYNCGIISYNNYLCMNFIRNCETAVLENEIAHLLSELSIEYGVESKLYY